MIKPGKGADIVHISIGVDIVKGLDPNKDKVLLDEDLLNGTLQFETFKNGCYLKDDDQINTFFKKSPAKGLALLIRAFLADCVDFCK